MKEKKLREFYLHGVPYYAHDENEVFNRYRENHVVQHGDILRIGKKFFKVLDNKLHQLVKGK